MTKVKIVLLDYRFSTSLYEAVKKVNEVTNNLLDFRFYGIESIEAGLVDSEKLKEDLSSPIVLLSCMGGDKVSKILCSELSNSVGTVIVFVGGSSELVNLTRLGSFSFKMMSRMGMGKKKKMNYETVIKMRERFEKLGSRLPLGMLKHAKNYSVLLKYYETPTMENYYGMFLFLMKEYGNAKIAVEIPPPKSQPAMGIMDFKNGVFSALEDYLKDYKLAQQPLIGLLFYGGHHYSESYPAAKCLTERLESLGYGVVPVFCADLRYYLAVEKFFFNQNKPAIDVLIDLLWFRFAGGPMGGDHSLTVELLDRLNVPVLHGLQLYTTTIEGWRASKHGLYPVETVTSVILPELDGRFEPIVTHGVKETVVDGTKIEEYTAVEEGIEKLARRAINWVKLKRKPNSEKKIAVIMYNYPPGEENIGKAECLDVFGSLSKLLQAMKAKGYTVPVESGLSGQDLMKLFLSEGAVNSGEWVQTPKVVQSMAKVSKDTYLKWLKQVPLEPLNRILKEWGQPPGTVMTRGESLLIPGLAFGNVFVGVQPTRGVHENLSKLYHDKDLPPHHQYVAFYEWLKNEFKADAVIHLGTHGTLEFLPGKEVGLSSQCYPDILIGDLPNVYVYHAVNSSECAIAKRRSYALTVNHASSPMTVSDLPGDFQDLEHLVGEYFDALQYSKEGAQGISEKIVEKAAKYDLGDTVEEVYDKLEEYKRSLIPKGLHVLGESLSERETVDYLTFLARYDRGETKSLHRLIAESHGYNYDELLKEPHKRGETGQTYAEILSQTEEETKTIIQKQVLKEESASQPKRAFGEEQEKSVTFLKTVYGRMRQSDELASVLDALEGQFIPVGPGGDFIRSPEIFPTGRNTSVLDPTRIPTEIAIERGKTVAEEYLQSYLAQHGVYPKAVSMVLWAFETMKTGGETVAAIFHLLGVKPVWKGLYIRDIEVIPLNQLNRPRIDVIVTICGIFRDTFYNVVELLDKAVQRVSELDEPKEMNFLKANTEALAGHGEAAKYRVFGPPEGQYATNITSIIESSEWKSESDIMNAYLDSMKYAYGEKHRSVETKEVFGDLLSHVELVAQIRDTVDYEVTDLDHYYEFLGGLTKTVEAKRGRRPTVLIADVTKEHVKVEDIKEASKRGIVTRTTNPKWLDSMLANGSNGASKIADRVEYMLGLQATVGSIENWMWDNAVNAMVFDKLRAEKIKQANPWTFAKMVGRFLEAHKRGYWQASDEVIKRLEQEYLEMEKTLEDNY
jgi:cobaltochelatase CobN